MAGVIRRNIPIQTTVLSLDNLERQAAEILDRAEKAAVERSSELHKQSQDSIRLERERGFQQGLEEGRKTGLDETRAAAKAAIDQARKEAQADLARLTQTLHASLAEIDNQRHRLHAEAERGLITLAIAIARRVCGSIVAKDANPAIDASRRLLDLVRHAHDVELQVNPSESDLLNAVTAEFVEKSESLKHVRLVANPEVSRGGAILVSTDGTIDATVETQLDRIAAALLDDDNAPATFVVEAGQAEQKAPTVEPADVVPETPPNPESADD